MDLIYALLFSNPLKALSGFRSKVLLGGYSTINVDNS